MSCFAKLFYCLFCCRFLGGGAPRAVVEELDFGAIFLDVEDGDAGVAEFKGGHLARRHFEDQGEQHAKDAAVSKDADSVSIFGAEEDVPDFLNSSAELFDGFSVGNGVGFQQMKPIAGAFSVFFSALLPIGVRSNRQSPLPADRPKERVSPIFGRARRFEWLVSSGWRSMNQKGAAVESRPANVLELGLVRRVPC